MRRMAGRPCTSRVTSHGDGGRVAGAWRRRERDVAQRPRQRAVARGRSRSRWRRAHASPARRGRARERAAERRTHATARGCARRRRRGRAAAARGGRGSRDREPRGGNAGGCGPPGRTRGDRRRDRRGCAREDEMRRVALVGAGVSKFGVRRASYRDLIWEAGKACFDSIPAVKPKDVEGLVVGSVMPERTAFQSHISSLAAEALGIKPSALSARTEHMCASGTVAIRYAYAFIAAGLADLVMVLGVEKLNAPTGEEAILNMGTGVDREWEAAFGLTAPPCFALAAQRHMAAYGTTEEQLAMVGVKNHTHAAKNPNAHFNKGATLDQVLGSRMIATPLRLFMCSPITDGAAAVILASEERARGLTDTPVWIRGTGQALDGFQLSSLHADYAHWPALKRAAQAAYQMAGVGPHEMDLAEVHDCFAIAELIAYEELGFCHKGEAGAFVAAGRSDYGGVVVVIPRAGLIACGHPPGPTGVARADEAAARVHHDV